MDCRIPTTQGRKEGVLSWQGELTYDLELNSYAAYYWTTGDAGNISYATPYTTPSHHISYPILYSIPYCIPSHIMPHPMLYPILYAIHIPHYIASRMLYIPYFIPYPIPSNFTSLFPTDTVSNPSSHPIRRRRLKAKSTSGGET